MGRAVLALGVVTLALAVWFAWRAGERDGGALPQVPATDAAVADATTVELVPVPAEDPRSLDVVPNATASAREALSTTKSAPHALGPRRLHVLDRASRRELAPVFVVELERDWTEKGIGHPGPASRDAVDLGPSPVEVPRRESGPFGARALYARSPGYAWGWIEVDEATGSEPTLLLDPGGDLGVTLDFFAPDPATKLRVRGAARAPLFEMSLTAPSRVEITALPAGDYGVTAERDEVWGGRRVLSQAPVTIVAGQHAGVTLMVAGNALRERVPLAGTLLLPAEWGLSRFQLDFEPLGPAHGEAGRFSIERSTMRSEGDPPYAFHWKAPDVPPDRYEVRLDAIGFTAILDVGAAGLPDARIEVPPPTEVRLRCLDAGTGAEIDDVDARWHHEFPDGSKSLYWPVPFRRDEALGSLVAHAAIGNLAIHVHAEGYDETFTTLTVVPGVNDFVLELERAAGVTVTCCVGGARVRWRDDQSPSLEPMEGQVVSPFPSWDFSKEVLRLYVQEPGLYSVTIPWIPGYEPVPPQVVRLDKGVVRELVIELVPKR